MTTLTTPKITVTASAIGNRGAVSVDVPLPNLTDIPARAAKIGLPSIRDQLLTACREHQAVVGYSTLREQIRAAERRVAAAERTFESARAAKRLLEDHPEEDLANKLRAIEGRMAAGEADRAAAISDLDTIRYLVPKTWATAANLAGSQVDTVAVQYALALGEPVKAAQVRLTEACRQAEAIITKAITDHVYPALEEALVANKANEAIQEVSRFVASILEAAIGAPPAGVRKANGRYVTEGDKPAVEPKEDKPPESPRAMNRILVSRNGDRPVEVQ